MKFMDKNLKPFIHKNPDLPALNQDFYLQH